MKKILFIPLDDRPCTCGITSRLISIAGFQPQIPPPIHTCKYRREEERTNILNFIKNTGEEYAGSLISTDMLLYGGLVESRKGDVSYEKALTTLDNLIEIIKEKKNQLGYVALFSTLMRPSPTYTDEAMIPVLETLLSYSTEYYQAVKGDGSAKKNLKHLEKKIPQDFLRSYMDTRRRNHEINKRLISLSQEGHIDLLYIGIDDSKTTGFNILEKEELETLMGKEQGQSPMVLVPGTDEAMGLIFARFLNHHSNKTPRIFPIYANSQGKNLVHRYEDRSLEQVIQTQITASGGVLSQSRQDADILLYINNSATPQKEAAVQKVQFRMTPHIENFVYSIHKALKKGNIVSIADVFYANGSDDLFIRHLINNINILEICSFAGWNTTGNSIGSALAGGIAEFYNRGRDKTHDEELQSNRERIHLLLERFLDDWLYQAVVRPKLTAEALIRRVSIFHLEDKTQEFEELTAQKMKSHIGEFFKIIRNKRINLKNREKLYTLQLPGRLDVTLPWDRLFEIKLEFETQLTPEEVGS